MFQMTSEKRGAIERTIRIPLHFLLFLFNDLVFPSIPSKSFRFRMVMFSTPTRLRQIILCVNNLASIRVGKSGQ
jgi:hypothetical protein